MDQEQLTRILDTLKADEVEDVLTFVRINEKAGHLSHEEAEKWRKQIRALQGFLVLAE